MRNEDKVIIYECEAGRDATVKNYREALNHSLSADVVTIVQRQFSGVQEAHRALSNLKHGRAATATSGL